jgi:hypothetical protein
MPTQKTFDQLVLTNPEIDPVPTPDAFAPHEAINARIVFEPMPAQGHVRITARTDDYELLWGMMASPKMLARHPAEVALYDRLIEHAAAHLPEQTITDTTDAISQVLQHVRKARRALDALENSITPKKVTAETGIPYGKWALK